MNKTGKALRFTGRFIGYARHNAQTECDQIRSMLFHEIHDLGLRGLKLHEQPNTEILDAVKELGIPVLYDSNQHVELILGGNIQRLLGQ